MTIPAPSEASATYQGIRVVGLDADDTLWHSENRFHATHERFRALLADHVDIDPDVLDARMLRIERDNLALFGYGAKGFILSLIETAIEVTGGAIPAPEIQAILTFGKDLLNHPVELLDGVTDTISQLHAAGLRLVLITKGDLWHQEAKIAASGVAEHFEAIEIVSEKDPATYARILERLNVAPSTFCMVGNSVRSDVLPVVDLGGHAVHVPYEYLWAHEAVAGADADPRFVSVASIRELPAVLGITAP